jgi:hypothetical protein
MRRISSPRYPNYYSYLPSSWPAMGALGKERVMGADGRMVAERDVIIPQYQIMETGIPMDGPRIATLALRTHDHAGRYDVRYGFGAESRAGIAVALLGNDPALRVGIPVAGHVGCPCIPVTCCRSGIPESFNLGQQ